MLSYETLDKFIGQLEEVWLDYPYGEDVAVYKVGKPDGKMMALVNSREKPLKVSLRCDPQLAVNLRQRYETVLPGFNLSKENWNTIICSGQLPDEDILDLVRHSYELSKSN